MTNQFEKYNLLKEQEGLRVWFEDRDGIVKSGFLKSADYAQCVIRHDNQDKKIPTLLVK